MPHSEKWAYAFINRKKTEQNKNKTKFKKTNQKRRKGEFNEPEEKKMTVCLCGFCFKFLLLTNEL